MISDFISPEDSRWANTLTRTPHDFYHYPDYVKLCAEYEGGIAVAFYAQLENNVFLAPLIIKPVNKSLSGGVNNDYNDAISPYGYSAPITSEASKEMTSQLWKFAISELIKKSKERKICTIFFRMHPLFLFPKDLLSQYGFLIKHGQTVSVDLTLSWDEIWEQTSTNHKREITKLRNKGAIVEIDETWKSLDDFLNIYIQTMNRVKANKYYYFPRRYFLKLHKVFPKQIHLCVVCLDKKVICAGLFTEIDGIVEYYLAGTKEEYLNISPSKLMHDFIRNWAKQRGNRIYHLGGGFGGIRDSLFLFKAGFSEKRDDFYTYRIIADENVYNNLVKQWENFYTCKADSVEKFFPPYNKILT